MIKISKKSWHYRFGSWYHLNSPTFKYHDANNYSLCSYVNIFLIFPLIEMLIALLIYSIIAIGVFLTFMSGAVLGFIFLIVFAGSATALVLYSIFGMMRYLEKSRDNEEEKPTTSRFLFFSYVKAKMSKMCPLIILED